MKAFIGISLLFSGIGLVLTSIGSLIHGVDAIRQLTDTSAWSHGTDCELHRTKYVADSLLTAWLLSIAASLCWLVLVCCIVAVYNSHIQDD